MQTEKIKEVLSAIKEYDKIAIFRHFRPDGDAVGSTKGLAAILRLSYPEKDIRVLNEDYSDYLAFTGEEDSADDSFLSGALGIAVDTATAKRLSTKRYALCDKLIKIDHHIPVESYGDINWEDENKSSACEMIAEFYYACRDELKIDSEAATYVYLGMVTDSGRFRYDSVSGDTMRYAGMLLDVGIDTETLYARLYMKERELFRFESYVYQHMKFTDAGVAYIHVTKKLQKKLGLSSEDASTAVSYMDSIKGSLIWMALIDNDDGTTRVRLRSRFLPINKLAEKYSGGGHACAAGATVHSKAEEKSLIAEADALLSEYKATNEGWI